MNYLKELEFTDEEINTMNNNLDNNIIESVMFFPVIIKTNYEYLKNIGIKNYKQIFMEHTHMFLLNPDRFKAIFEKYDPSDLIRCLEKNGAVIEKL
jgi:ACR3 family arsenite efflux pump ArsB